MSTTTPTTLQMLFQRQTELTAAAFSTIYLRSRKWMDTCQDPYHLFDEEWARMLTEKTTASLEINNACQTHLMHALQGKAINPVQLSYDLLSPLHAHSIANAQRLSQERIAENEKQGRKP